MKSFFCLTLLFIAAIAQTYVQSEVDLVTPLRVRMFYSDGEDKIYVRLLSNQKLSASATTREAANMFQLAKKSANANWWTLQDIITESFVSAEATGKKSLRATRPHDRTWETFEVEAAANRMFHLKSKANGKYFVVTEFNTITAKVNTAAEATAFGFEHFVEATIGDVFLRSIRRMGVAAAVNPADNTVTLVNSAPTTYVTFRIVPLTSSSTGSLRRSLPPVAYTEYTLQSTANQKFLCYDTMTNVVYASCTDNSAVNTHFHFLNGQAVSSDYVIIANNLGKFLKIDANGHFSAVDMTTNVASQFEIAEDARRPDSSYAISLQDTQDYWMDAQGKIGLSLGNRDSAQLFSLRVVDEAKYIYNIILDTDKYLTVNSADDFAILQQSSDVSNNDDYEWEIVNTGSNIYKITSRKNSMALYYDSVTGKLKADAISMTPQSGWLLDDLTGKKRLSPIAREI